ncbi:MAG: ComEC/Rec2 family competence protein [Spirochaetales bacterium]|nr:ComEC/Rec2 family competence protein [Spirochaetales bacterium]
MGKIIAHPEYLVFPVLFSILGVSVVLHSFAAGMLCILSLSASALFLACAYCPGDRKQKAKFLHLYLLSLCLMLSSLLCVNVNRSLDPDFCFPKEYVREIEGRVVYDSSFTENGNHLMKISVDSCTLISGERGEASGILAAVGRETAILSSGLRVRLEGTFSEDLFIYDSLSVLRRSVLNDMRERIIEKLEYRLTGSSAEEAGLLSIRLLLGRADSGKTSIQEKAAQCGCSHVLALSGMHLGIIAALGSFLFPRRKRLAGFVSSVLVAAFVFAAGPRASLIRAALFFALARIPAEKRIFIVFARQCLLFPSSMPEPGCAYGYLAVFAIIHISPWINGVLHQYIGKLSTLVSASLSVLVLSVPLQMILNGFWCPAVIIASSAAGLLAAFSMVIGLLLLALGQLPALLWANRIVYTAMDRLFDLMLRLPHSGWWGYGILLGVLGLLFGMNQIRRRSVMKNLTPYKIGNKIRR